MCVSFSFVAREAEAATPEISIPSKIMVCGFLLLLLVYARDSRGVWVCGVPSSLRTIYMNVGGILFIHQEVSHLQYFMYMYVLLPRMIRNFYTTIFFVCTCFVQMET